jgi:hypothetical protein
MFDFKKTKALETYQAGSRAAGKKTVDKVVSRSWVLMFFAAARTLAD